MQISSFLRTRWCLVKEVLLLKKFEQLGTRAGMMKPGGYFGQIPKGVEWRWKNKTKSTISSHFLGIFGIFRGGKGTPYHKSRKIILFNILPSQQSKQLFLTKYFPFFLYLGDSQFS
jgi:hypothetical protein